MPKKKLINLYSGESPGPDPVVLYVHVPAELKQGLQEVSNEYGISMSSLTRQLLEQALALVEADNA